MFHANLPSFLVKTTLRSHSASFTSFRQNKTRGRLIKIPGIRAKSLSHAATARYPFKASNSTLSCRKKSPSRLAHKKAAGNPTPILNPFTDKHSCGFPGLQMRVGKKGGKKERGEGALGFLGEGGHTWSWEIIKETGACWNSDPRMDSFLYRCAEKNDLTSYSNFKFWIIISCFTPMIRQINLK